MAKVINSYLGKVHLLTNNPRTIRDSAFNRLVESIERDPDFLLARGIVVWQVPEVSAIPKGEKNPFAGQEGRLVVLGGNQRTKALLALGKSELKREWIVEAKNADGSWFSPAQAERFVLLDNGGEGISGENDYEKMLASFSENAMRLTGIDFSAFEGLMQETAEKNTKTPEEEAEEGEHGEKNQDLKTFIEHREETRRNLKAIDDAGFYLLLVFDSFEEKAEFISRSGLTGKNKRVKVDGDVFLCLVFESYEQKMEFIEKSGLANDDEQMGDGELEVVYDKFCDGRALARKMGIELKESGFHFRDRKVDSQLAEMTQDEKPQRSEGEIETEIFETARKEARKTSRKTKT